MMQISLHWDLDYLRKNNVMKLINVFLKTKFEGGRHTKRIKRFNYV